MPTVTEQPITGLAFCVDGRCPGYNQEPVPALKRTSEFSYLELGGDLPGIERSSSQVLFVNDDDAVCALCGKPRMVSDQERPEYPNTSGQDPMAIFNREGSAAQMRDVLRNQEVEQLRHNSETAGLKTLLAEQAAAMERMSSAIEELQSRPRGPGRPRKPEESE